MMPRFHEFNTEPARLFLDTATLELYVHAPPPTFRPEPPPPRPPAAFSNFQVFVTNRCNLACEYCQITSPRTGPPAPDTLTESVLREVLTSFLDQAPPTATIFFTGGEPLLAFDKVLSCLHTIRAHRNGHDRRVYVFTNGLLLNGERLRALADCGTAIIVSLDGPAPVQDSRRIFADGSGSYRAVAEKLDLARQLGIPYGISAVLGKHNLATAAEDAAFIIDRFQPQSISFNLLHGCGTQLPLLSEAPELAAEVTYAIQKVAAKHGVFVESAMRYLGPIVRRQPRSAECSACGKKVVLNGRGTFAPCSVVAARAGIGSASLGSLRRAELFETWASRTVDGMPTCRACPLRYICGGGCGYDASRWGPGFCYPPPGQCQFVRRLLELFMANVAEKVGLLPPGTLIEPQVLDALAPTSNSLGAFRHSAGHQST